jgi:hypothetical protein
MTSQNLKFIRSIKTDGRICVENKNDNKSLELNLASQIDRVMIRLPSGNTEIRTFASVGLQPPDIGRELSDFYKFIEDNWVLLTS